MSPPVLLLPGAISDLFAYASTSGTLTLADRYGLMAALLEDSLTEEERMAIDRLLRSLYRGRMKIINELSVVA
ncbi:MAG TPA: hypothetical protein V6D37_10910 [Candidatus Sericytochromatia bacterium]|jgi:hypothetical protein